MLSRLKYKLIKPNKNTVAAFKIACIIHTCFTAGYFNKKSKLV